MKKNGMTFALLSAFSITAQAASVDLAAVVADIAKQHGYSFFTQGVPKPQYVTLGESAKISDLPTRLQVLAGQAPCADIVLRRTEIGVRYKEDGSQCRLPVLAASVVSADQVPAPEAANKSEPEWNSLEQIGDLFINPKYMSKKQAAWLEQIKADRERARNNPAPAEATAAPPAREKVPNEKALAKEATIPSLEKQRLMASKDWERTGVAPELVSAGGQIEYAYSQSRPTITCAPLHICTMSFIAGESITSMSIGDSVRWLAQSTTAGQRPVVVVKPTQAGLATNLVVTTDKGRVYYLHLVSSKTDYVPMISFYDPESIVTDMRQQAEMESARRKAEELAKSKAVVADLGKVTDPTKLDFGYRCKGDADFKPVRLFSNDTHTFIQMPPDMKSSDAPAVFNSTSGRLELLNSRLSNGYYVVDGKPQKIKLVVGPDGEGAQVECTHQSKSKDSFTHSSPFFGG